MRERKFIVGLDSQDRLKLKAGYVLFHRDLIDVVKNFSENHDVSPIGGGFWTIKDGEIHLYGSSSDFGRPRRLEEALKTDGDHFRQQITMAERRIQGDDDLDCCEMPVVYTNELGEKIYTEIGQKDYETEPLPVEPRESVSPMPPRGSNKTPSTKGAAKAKKAKRRATKKHYGKRK
jgi:hypothetical protein